MDEFQQIAEWLQTVLRKAKVPFYEGGNAPVTAKFLDDLKSGKLRCVRAPEGPDQAGSVASQRSQQRAPETPSRTDAETLARKEYFREGAQDTRPSPELSLEEYRRRTPPIEVGRDALAKRVKEPDHPLGL